MIFDVNLLFFHTGNVYNFTAGEYVSLVGCTSLTSSCTSTVINLGVPEDMGIGDGEFIPKVRVLIGSSGITTSCTAAQLNFQFQGSTDSTTWTTYGETGFAATSSYLANTFVFNQDVPRRPVSWNGLPTALPQYYRIQMQMSAQATGSTWITTVGISTGSLIGGIVLQAPDNDDTLKLYSAGFSVS